jgi:hypothetical protein
LPEQALRAQHEARARVAVAEAIQVAPDCTLVVGVVVGRCGLGLGGLQTVLEPAPIAIALRIDGTRMIGGQRVVDRLQIPLR